jgi:hypothetical protein
MHQRNPAADYAGGRGMSLKSQKYIITALIILFMVSPIVFPVIAEVVAVPTGCSFNGMSFTCRLEWWQELLTTVHQLVWYIFITPFLGLVFLWLAGVLFRRNERKRSRVSEKVPE